MSKYQSLDDAILARVKNRWPLAPMTHALIMATSQVRDLAEAAVAGTSRPAFRAVDARLQALRKKGLIEYSNALGWSLRWPYCAVVEADGMTTLRDAAQQALGALETVLSDAYHRRFLECCGRPGIECCGNPNEAWTQEDNKIMELLSPAQRQLSDALRAALAEPQRSDSEHMEPVAAQHRFRHPQKSTPDWSVWQPCKVAQRPAWEIDSQGYEVEYRALYAAPQPVKRVGS